MGQSLAVARGATGGTAGVSRLRGAARTSVPSSCGTAAAQPFGVCKWLGKLRHGDHLTPPNRLGRHGMRSGSLDVGMVGIAGVLGHRDATDRH